jgi:hypothetical protein
VTVLERSGDCYEGRVVLQVKAAGFPTRWEAVHAGGKRGEFFIDTQQKGPFVSWQHTHRFIPVAPGTAAASATSELEDTIVWQAPLGALGAAIGGVQARLERGFAFRHARTAEDLRRHGAHIAAGGKPMRILLSGASGLVGRQLTAFLDTGGHEVIQLVRRAPRGAREARWDPAAGQIDLSAVGEIDAVIHLSGESVSKRWTPERKAEIIASRERSTTLLATAIAALPRRPAVFISASAVGWYGSRGDEVLTEQSAPGATGFLPEVCRRWEAGTQAAKDAGIRTVNLRIGVVLSARGGALAELLPPILAGAGGPVGTGKQMFPWIAIDDLLYLVHWLLTAPVAGAVNATAPTPVTNRAFMQAIGHVVGRPTFMPLPAFAVRALFGEMGREVLLEGQNAIPAVATAAGFQFTFPNLENALRHELGHNEHA